MQARLIVGIATPPGMTAANGYLSAASALGYDRDEGLDFQIYYGESRALRRAPFVPAPATLPRLILLLACLGVRSGSR
jgi:hypothetical protein